MAGTKEIVKRLEARLRELGARIEDIEDDLRETPNENWIEKATETEQNEALEALENSALAEISSIRAALRRLREGGYGICSNCGESIAQARLDAVPYATQCIKCAGGQNPD